MISVLVTLVGVVSIALGAPTSPANPLLAQQFVVLTPPAAAAPQHIQYDTVLKLDQPLFQQITPLGRIETPQKQQLLLLYPNGPLTQYPLISLRQDGGNTDIWQTIQNFFTSVAGNFGQPDAPPDAPPAAPAPETAKLESAIFTDAPKPAAIAAAIEPAPAPTTSNFLPASSVPLTEKRYYILSGQPQFYGKYNALHAPLNSVFHLQPLQATIDARSAAASAIPAATPGAALNGVPADEAPVSADAAVPLQQAVPLQLRSAFQAPLQAFEPTAAILPAFAEQHAEPAALAPEAAALKASDTAAEQLPQASEPRALVELPAPESDEQPSSEPQTIVVVPDVVETARANAGAADSGSASDANALAEEPQQSVANARPLGVAVAGRGGLAAAKPSATAVVGDRGLAMAAPVATAISGDFKEDTNDEVIEEEVVIEEEFDKKKNA